MLFMKWRTAAANLARFDTPAASDFPGAQTERYASTRRRASDRERNASDQQNCDCRVRGDFYVALALSAASEMLVPDHPVCLGRSCLF